MAVKLLKSTEGFLRIMDILLQLFKTFQNRDLYSPC